MGGKISKRLRGKRSEKTKTSQQCTEMFDFNDDNNDHFYENIDERIDRTDTVSEDRTYYEDIEQDLFERHPTILRSKSSLCSTDSAFSERSSESEKCIYSRQQRRLTPSCQRRHSMLYDNHGYCRLPTKKGDDKSQHHDREMIPERELNESFSGWAQVCEEPMERLVFLLDAYEPLIISCVNVMDVIQYLPFIENTATFSEKHRESPPAAVALLIQTLKGSEEPGKWQSFLDALIAAGYKYIAKLLREETEADHTISRKLLRLFTPELISRIDPEEFIDHLLSTDDVIGDTDREEIQCEKRNRGDIAASLMLLERLPRRLENWFEIFVDVLRKCRLEDLTEYFITKDISSGVTHPRPKPSVSNSYYLTPIYGKGSTHDTNPKLQTNTPEGNRSATESVTDQEIEFLKQERDRLFKQLEQLEKDKEILSLRAEVCRLQRELDERKTDNLQLYPVDLPNKKSASEDKCSVNSKQSEQEQKENEITNSTQNTDKRLDSIVKGVGDITELLRDIKDGLKVQNAQNGNTINNGALPTLVGNPYEFFYPPTAHRLKKVIPSSSYQHRSLDSAISIGYAYMRPDIGVYV